jgi:hypothetical protein
VRDNLCYRALGTLALISFKDRFLVGDEGDEEGAGLAALLTMLRRRWGESSFKASDVARSLEPEDGPPPQEAREMHASSSVPATSHCGR